MRSLGRYVSRQQVVAMTGISKGEVGPSVDVEER